MNVGIELEKPLYLRRGIGRLVSPAPVAKLREKASSNALLGMGLWTLLWLGYNSGLAYVEKPNFPNNTLELIHGVRAFFPMLAAWFACLVILFRSRLYPWIVGPMGLILLYAVTGLASSATLSPHPGDALYYGVNYLAIVLVVLATALGENPLPDLRWVLRLTWSVGTLLTFVLLFAGSRSVGDEEMLPVGANALSGTGSVLDMAASRNTGFARYAAISALVAIPAMMKKGSVIARVFWGIIFAGSIYALIKANGRTETLGFIFGVVALFAVQKAQRFALLLIGLAGGILLALQDFYARFYHYFTRTGHFDFTLTGRTMIWEKGFDLVLKSPWVGYGFQADRYFLNNMHIHDAFLHALIQSGLMGGGAIILALIIIWYYVLRYFFISQPSDKSLIPPDIPAVLLFVTFSSLTESTFAYFSAAWLLSAPIAAYVIALHWHVGKSRAKAARQRLREDWSRRRRLHGAGFPARFMPPPPLAGGPKH